MNHRILSCLLMAVIVVLGGWMVFVDGLWPMGLVVLACAVGLIWLIVEDEFDDQNDASLRDT